MQAPGRRQLAALPGRCRSRARPRRAARSPGGRTRPRACSPRGRRRCPAVAAGGGEQVVPLQHLVQHDAVDEAAEPDTEQEARQAGRPLSPSATRPRRAENGCVRHRRRLSRHDHQERFHRRGVDAPRARAVRRRNGDFAGRPGRADRGREGVDGDGQNLSEAAQTSGGSELVDAVAKDVAAKARQRENPMKDFKPKGAMAGEEILEEMRAVNTAVREGDARRMRTRSGSGWSAPPSAPPRPPRRAASWASGPSGE